MAFLFIVSISITLGIMGANYADPAQGIVWSIVFWASLFGSIIGTTMVIKYFMSLFGDNSHTHDWRNF